MDDSETLNARLPPGAWKLPLAASGTITKTDSSHLPAENGPFDSTARLEMMERKVRGGFSWRWLDRNFVFFVILLVLLMASLSELRATYLTRLDDVTIPGGSSVNVSDVNTVLDLFVGNEIASTAVFVARTLFEFLALKLHYEAYMVLSSPDRPFPLTVSLPTWLFSSSSFTLSITGLVFVSFLLRFRHPRSSEELYCCIVPGLLLGPLCRRKCPGCLVCCGLNRLIGSADSKGVGKEVRPQQQEELEEVISPLSSKVVKLHVAASDDGEALQPPPVEVVICGSGSSMDAFDAQVQG